MRPWTQTVTGLLVAVVVAAVAVVTTAAPAAAHARLVSATPEAGSSVRDLPASVTLTFNQSVRTPAYVRVTGPGGVAVSTGGPKVIDEVVTQRLDQSAGGGRYSVSYRVSSADGHPIEGTLRFSVSGSPDTGQAAAPTRTTASPTGGISTGQLLLLLGALLCGLLAMAAGTSRAVKHAAQAIRDEPAGHARRR